jgi:hypothetical protein
MAWTEDRRRVQASPQIYATAKGHLDQQRQKVKSTKTDNQHVTNDYLASPPITDGKRTPMPYMCPLPKSRNKPVMRTVTKPDVSQCNLTRQQTHHGAT